MQSTARQSEILTRLKGEILSLEGYGRDRERPDIDTGLGNMLRAFPGARFPTAAVHEFLSPGPEQAAATSGFLCGLVKSFLQPGSSMLWISCQRLVYPPALKHFGLNPERIIFVDLRSEKEALWAIEEALKCASLPVVVGELKELDFTQSRRLQLAVEESGVTAFIHRRSPRAENTTASLTRWKITPLPSEPEAGLPGVGHPRWQVSLLKVRNGRPGSWPLEWSPRGFRHVPNLRATARNPVIIQTA